MADRPELVASFFTLTGSGFGEPPRHSFADRCRAAAAAGFAGIGLHVDDVPRTLAAGSTLSDLRNMLTDNGLRVVEIEFLGGWATVDHDPVALSRTLDGIERVADAVGGRHVSTGEFRGDTTLDPGAAQRLAAVARRLGERGLILAVEAFPWSVLRGPTTVPDLIDHAGAANVGQLVDVWHFWNNDGDPASLTGPIAAVQLNDGPRVHDDYLRHARAARRLPGEGDLDVTATIQAVLRAGYTGPWCVEVNTPEFRALPVGEAAHQAATHAFAALRAAGISI